MMVQNQQKSKFDSSSLVKDALFSLMTLKLAELYDSVLLCYS